MRAAIAGELFGEDIAALTIGRYRVRERIGHGGMGVVYAAWDPSLARKVALKLLATRAPNRARRERMLREAQALAKLSHPNVVQVYEVAEHGGQVFVAMELVPGVSLRAWMESPRTPDEIQRVFVEAGEGLHAAHTAGLVHRDFKPSNVLCGEDGRVRVVDFGLAVGPGLDTDTASSSGSGDSVQRVTQTGGVVGTPAYMAPEQFSGARADARADQFSYCVSLFEAVTGRRPYDVAALREPARAEAPRWQLVPRRWRSVLMRGLAFDPAERWPDMGAVLDQMRRAGTRRRRAVVGIAVVAAVGGVAWLGRGEEGPCSDVPETPPEWSDSRAQALEDGFLATGAPFAETVWAGANDRLDAFTEQWVDARDSVCSSDPQPAQLACLRAERVELEAVLRAYAGVEADNIASVHALATLLRNPARCRERAPETLPLEPAQLEQLANARALVTASRPADALEKLDTLVDDPQLAHTEARSEVYALRGRAHEQLAHADAAAQDYARALGGSQGPHRQATNLAHLVRHYVAQERLQSAQDTLRILDTVAPDEPAELRADLLELRGSVLSLADEHAAAVAILEEALRLRTDTGDDDDVSRTRTRLANALVFSADPAGLRRAEELYRRELADREQRLGPWHPQVAIALFNLAIFIADNHEDWARAETLLRRAEEIEARTLPPDSPSRARTRLKLANILIRLERPDEAKPMLDSAWARLGSLPAEHSDHIAARRLLADFALAHDDHHASVEHHHALAEQDPSNFLVFQNLAYSAARLDDTATARDALARARALIELKPPPAALLGLLQLYLRSIDAEIARAEGERQRAYAIVDEVEKGLRTYEPTGPFLTFQRDALRTELQALRDRLGAR